MADVSSLPPESNPDLLLRLLRKEIALALKEDLMKVAEERVDAVVNDAVSTLRVQVQTALDRMYGEQLIKVLVERINR